MLPWQAVSAYPFAFHYQQFNSTMKVKQILFSFLTASWLLSSCGENDCCVPVPAGEYAQGIFVVNEGPFGGTGTISWHNPDTGETQDSLFEKANNGAVLGQFVQSLTFHNGKGYIVVNGANRVVVVDAETFEFLDTIGGLALPRYFLPLDDNTAYISQWGLDGLTGSVAKVDLNTNSVIKTIPTGIGPDKMLRRADRVYVANSGGYGVDASITEILTANDQVQIKPIPTGKNPSTLAWHDQKLFYLCKGYFLDANPIGWLNFEANTGPGLEVPSYSDDLQVDPDNGDLFFIGGGNVYRGNASNLEGSLSILFAQSAYGLGFDSAQNLLYCADAKDFASAGEVVVYTTSGTQTSRFRCGIAPGEVVIVK